jgi:hypothetical protein
VVLSRPGYDELYQVLEAGEAAVSDFTLTGKATRLELKGENLYARFDHSLRATVVFGISEELAQAGKPITEPVRGDRIVLSVRAADLESGRPLIVTGKPARLQVPDGGLTLTDASGATTTAQADESLQVLAAPVDCRRSRRRWQLRDAAGFEGGCWFRLPPLPAEEDAGRQQRVELLSRWLPAKITRVAIASAPPDLTGEHRGQTSPTRTTK